MPERRRRRSVFSMTAYQNHACQQLLSAWRRREDARHEGTLADLAAVGTRIVTIGQYLRPTSHHLPIARWWAPEEFDELKRIGETEFGLDHVESSPLTRSSHHAGSVATGLTVGGERRQAG